MPRKAAKKEEHLDDDLALDEVPEADIKPKKARKSKASPDGDTPTPKKPKAEPKTKYTPGQPFTDDHGFTNVFPSIIYKMFGEIKPSSKIAGLDFDETLIMDHKLNEKQKEQGHKDWVAFSKEVKPKLHEWLEDGYRLVIFSNQNGIKASLEGKMATKVKNRVNEFVEEMDVPITVLMAPAKDHMRKPEIGMWEFLRDTLSMGQAPDASQSFFVGDAAGRPGDHADTDMGFADKVGMKFHIPEEVFGAPVKKKIFHQSPKKKGEPVATEAVCAANAGLVETWGRLIAMVEAGGMPEAKDKFRRASYIKGIFRDFPMPITSVKDVTGIAGVGKATLAKVKEYLETGKLADLDGYEGVAMEEPEAVKSAAHAFL